MYKRLWVLCVVSSALYAQMPEFTSGKALIDYLVRQAEQDKKRGKQLTQSQAHLLSNYFFADSSKAPKPMREQIIYRYDTLKNFLLPNQSLIYNVFQQERAFRDNPPQGKKYYVFYTAVPYMHLMQDLARELYLYNFGEQGALSRNDAQNGFQFLRYFYKDPFFDQYKNVNDYLQTEVRKNKIVDDNLLRNKIILLSTNISLFGGLGITGESTFFYLNRPQKWVSPNPMFIEDSLNSYGFLNVTDYSKEFLDVIQHDLGYEQATAKLADPSPAAAKEAILCSDLFQIFIPADLVDTIAYLSWRQGFPFDKELLKQLFPNKLKGDVPTLDDSVGILAKDISEAIENVQQGLLPQAEQRLHKIIDEKHSLASYIDKNMVTQNDKLLNFMQARILITNDALLNPTSGIYVYRYDSIPEDTKEGYKDAFNEVFSAMTQKEPQGESQLDIRLLNLLMRSNYFLVTNDPLRKLTPTQYLLTMQDAVSHIKQSAQSLHKNSSIIRSIIAREEQYDSDYYVFYTAVPYMRLFQDIAGLLHEHIQSKPLDDFFFLRFDAQNPLYKKYAQVVDFMKDTIAQYCIIDDRISNDIKALLLSTNITLFGNADLMGESTWQFFNIPQPWAVLNKVFIQPMLAEAGFDNSAVDEFLKHADLLKNDADIVPADLMQIFIPKKIANTFAYISWTRGIPFDQAYIAGLCAMLGYQPPLVEQVFKLENLPTAKSIKEFMIDVESACKNNNQPLQSLAQKLVQNVSQGSFYVSQFYDNPQSPEIAQYYDRYQARILMTKTGMLNPASGIKMFRYSTLTATQEQEYMQKLRETFNEMAEKKSQQVPVASSLEGRIKACLQASS